MNDFEGNELKVGDEVLFAFTQFKNTTMKRGTVVEIGIRQAGMLMAKISHSNTKSRVIGHKISKV